jgi:hypothetical protein
MTREEFIKKVIDLWITVNNDDLEFYLQVKIKSINHSVAISSVILRAED